MKPTTKIARHTAQAIYVRGASLVDDLIGKLTFTEMMYFQLLGARPTPAQTKILDAVLVTLMEHGITPSAIATRMIYDSCPEAIQAAVAAGILGVGSTFIGTMEGCAKNLEEILAAPEGDPRPGIRLCLQYHDAPGDHHARAHRVPARGGLRARRGRSRAPGL